MQLLYLLVGIATTPQQNVQALDFFVGQVAQQGRDAKSLIQAVDSTSQQQYAEVVKRMTKEQREKLHRTILDASAAVNQEAHAVAPAAVTLGLAMSKVLPILAQFEEEAMFGTNTAVMDQYGSLVKLAQLVRPDETIPEVARLRLGLEREHARADHMTAELEKTIQAQMRAVGLSPAASPQQNAATASSLPFLLKKPAGKGIMIWACLATIAAVAAIIACIIFVNKREPATGRVGSGGTGRPAAGMMGGTMGRYTPVSPFGSDMRGLGGLGDLASGLPAFL